MHFLPNRLIKRKSIPIDENPGQSNRDGYRLPFALGRGCNSHPTEVYNILLKQFGLVVIPLCWTPRFVPTAVVEHNRSMVRRVEFVDVRGHACKTGVGQLIYCPMARVIVPHFADDHQRFGCVFRHSPMLHRRVKGVVVGPHHFDGDGRGMPQVSVDMAERSYTNAQRRTVR